LAQSLSKAVNGILNLQKQVAAADAQLGMVAVESYPFNGGVGNNATSYAYYLNNGYKINNSTQTSYGNSVATNDIVGVAIDLDNGKIWFSKNGTWQASGDPAAGTNAAFTGISNSDTYAPAVSKDSTGTNTFSGTLQLWLYAPLPTPPPAGFKSLNTANLPTPNDPQAAAIRRSTPSSTPATAAPRRLVGLPSRLTLCG
jgi:hypothetical protein